jgi:hypothetical protein
MTRAEAKREACFVVSLLCDKWDGDAVFWERYTESDSEKVQAGIREIKREMTRRGWRRSEGGEA